jgi:Lon protease-like protein
MGRILERFPLFPLGLVLLPGEPAPLHIFEDRYRQMIGRCIDEESEFGIVWMSDDGLREIGCGARVERVTQEFDDGRFNVVVEGTRPFRLLRRIEDLPWPAGDVELLDDDEEPLDQERASAARESYADLVEHVTDERPSPEDLAEVSAYAMLGTVDVGLAAKQELLEERSESRRMERIEELFRDGLKRVERAEEVAERARSNGSATG